MLIQFTVYPLGIGKLIHDGGTGITLDVTRQKVTRIWNNYTSNGGRIGGTDPDTTEGSGGPSTTTFSNDDTPNDDNPTKPDEDVTFYVSPTSSVSDTIYARDMPGEFDAGPTAQNREIIAHDMREFVRFRFDGVNNWPEALIGSRGSEKVAWHSMVDIKSDRSIDGTQGLWERVPSFYNEILLGALTVPNP